MQADQRHGLVEKGEAGCFVAAGCSETDDLCAYEYASRPWEALAEPIARGLFANRKDYLVTRSIIIYRESFASPTRLRGMSPAGMLAVVLPLRFADRCRYWGNSPGGGFIPAMLPGAFDVVMDRGQLQLLVLIARDFLRESLPEDSVDALERCASMHQLPIHEDEVDRLARWLLAILGAGGRRTERASQAALSRVVEEELPWRLARACHFPSDPLAPPKASARRRALDRAIAFLRDADIASVGVGDLCRATGAKQRTLEYGFQEGLGLSPLGFLRLARLHTVRRELAAAKRGMTTVADIAHRFGIMHHGRFAGEYGSLFGEMPSRTLARPPVVLRSPLLLAKNHAIP